MVFMVLVQRCNHVIPFKMVSQLRILAVANHWLKLDGSTARKYRKYARQICICLAKSEKLVES